MSQQGRGRWDGLDGIRALAALAVVVFHADGRLAPRGFLGVDVFFVLSGFLITTLLRREQGRTGRVRVGRFLGRRALRLYPALAVMTLAVMAIAVATAHHVGAVLLGGLATLAYVANIWEYTGHETYLFQHTWTLAIEQQFYLVWPLLFVLMARSRAARVVIPVIAVATALILQGSDTAVVGTYVRGADLIVGCALAYAWSSERARRAVAALGWPALILIAAVVVLPWSASWSVSWTAWGVAALTVPLIAAATAGGVLERVLSVRPLRWMGLRSYSLYLWHFPIVSVLLNNVPSSTPQAARVVGGILASIVAAHLSYEYVERPALRWRARSPQLAAPLEADGANA